MSIPQNDALSHGLQTLILTPQSRREFVNSLWNCDLPHESFRPPQFEAFFRYYQDQCTTILCENHCQSKTHRDVINRARQLVGSLIQSQIQTILDPDETDEEDRAWTFLSARVLTMIDIGYLQSGVRLGQVPRVWAAGELRDFIKSTFPITKQEPEVKLERLFTACNLEQIAGIQVIWTSNIADHLVLEDDDTSVRIFSHASFLELHKSRQVNTRSS